MLYKYIIYTTIYVYFQTIFKNQKSINLKKVNILFHTYVLNPVYYIYARHQKPNRITSFI